MRNQIKHYRILDVNLSLESDSRELFRIFDLDYSWSRDRSPDFQNNLDLSVVLNPDGREPYIRNGNNHLRIASHSEKLRFSFHYILEQLMKHTRNYFLLHAGVASNSGRAVIIAGLSGMGKTTMIIELLKKGFMYFSDECCPISRETGLVHPYPRDLWIIPENREKTTKRDYFIRQNKEPHTAEDLGYHTARLPDKPEGLFFLTDGRQNDKSVRLLIKENSRIIDRLKSLDNIEIEKLKKAPPPEWSVTYPRGQGLTQTINKILNEHKDSVNFMFRVDPVSPDYNTEPELTAIQTPDMAFRLMNQMQNLKEFAGIDNNTKPGLQMMELCELLEEVPCFLLKVGRLDQMVNLVLKLS